MALSVIDPVSYANSEDYLTLHAEFDWQVDFKRKVIDGSVTLKLKNITKKKIPMKLDTKHLHVTEVLVQGHKVAFQLSDCNVKALGSCLSFPVETVDNELKVVIKYSTTDKCTALQWLNAEATKGKKHPYLFSQCQAIHARSLYPCQDSPSVKFPYAAKVRAPSNLNVLMSAVKDGEAVKEANHTVHKFHQKIPVPSYLVAIVCGNLEGRKIGPRSTVWSEPEMVDDAAREFEDTEMFLKTGEDLCGPYVWGIYDVLVLPPSFPYGGMENPCLTFVTPTLLVGDKSLVFVIAHEITHSWTGNLVTNKTWEDFWLNEGHTRYVERLIMEKYYDDSEPMRHLLIETGLACLQESLNDYGEGHAFNQMVPKLIGVDPDDCFSRVPYEKGSNLLFHLECVCGKDKMLRWLKAYVNKYKFLSLTTAEWKTFFYDYMTAKEDVSKSVLDAVNWEDWFYGRWVIPVTHNLNHDLGNKSEQLADQWISLANISHDQETDLLAKYQTMKADQQYYFLQVLNDFREAVLSHDKLKLMGRLYGYESSTNSEILFGWSMLVIRAKYSCALDQVFAFLNSQGRLKYTKPIYKALNNWPDVRARTVANFTTARTQLHPITACGVHQLLGLPQ